MLNKILTSNKCTVSVIGVEFTFTKNGCNWFQIERVFVKKADRGNGYLAKGLKKLVEFADKNKIRLSSCFLPDNEKHYNTLRKSFAENGFIPVEMDGETYRNDVDRIVK